MRRFLDFYRARAKEVERATTRILITTHRLIMLSSSSQVSSSNPSIPATPTSLHESSGQGNFLPLSPSVADLSIRRSISDSVLAPGRGYTGSMYNDRNTTYMMISRSGGSTVKQMLKVMCNASEAQERGDETAPPPEQECCIVAQWAADTYYRIVIAANNGIPILVRTMQSFPAHCGVQECCCIALGNLCSNGGGNLRLVEECGGVFQVIQAMKNHQHSVAVQSAACDALRNMCGLVVMYTYLPSSSLVEELITALAHAKQMHLLPNHRQLADELLTVITRSSV